MSGKIYVGFDGRGSFKIGKTKDHKARLAQFRTSNPAFQYLFVIEVEDPIAAERDLHEKFQEQWITGEWFALNSWDLKWIYDELVGSGRHSQKDFDIVWKAICLQKIANNSDFAEFIKDYDPVCLGGAS